MRYYFTDSYGTREACLVAYTDASDAVMIAHTDSWFGGCVIQTTHEYRQTDRDAVMAFAHTYDAETVELWDGDGYTEREVTK